MDGWREMDGERWMERDGWREVDGMIERRVAGGSQILCTIQAC